MPGTFTFFVNLLVERKRQNRITTLLAFFKSAFCRLGFCQIQANLLSIKIRKDYEFRQILCSRKINIFIFLLKSYSLINFQKLGRQLSQKKIRQVNPKIFSAKSSYQWHSRMLFSHLYNCNRNQLFELIRLENIKPHFSINKNSFRLIPPISDNQFPNFLLQLQQHNYRKLGKNMMK